MTNTINPKETEQKVQASAQSMCMICGKKDHVEGARCCSHCGQSFINPPQQKCECGRWKHSRKNYCSDCGNKNW